MQPDTQKDSFSKPEGDGYLRKVIFSYSINHLPQTRKVSFFYALKGRAKNEGLLKRCNIQQLARGALLAPAERAEEVEAFLKLWGCNYVKREAIVRGGGAEEVAA